MEMADGQQLRIFDKNFKRLLYVHIYAKPRNCIQLSLNLTKLRHVKRKYLVIFCILLENIGKISMSMV